ncbi:phage fiber-tail adaptor protein [Halomonas elongata]|uniref:phage fiber-tail adaptor protein n=1 Tax=Halomonas elongata TaxID=2746 RepID=UPI004034E9DD
MKTFKKQPRDHLDYDIDLSEWMAEGDEVEHVEVTAPDGLEVTQVGIEPNRVKLWIKGGTDGESYKLSPLIYTESRTKEVDFMIIVVEM